jgi:hypothetical protein
MLLTNVMQNYVSDNPTLVSGIENIFLLLSYLFFASFIMLIVYVVVQTLKFLKQKARMPPERDER